LLSKKLKVYIITVMMSQHKLQEITQYLTQTLPDYEVIPANFGWHIHLQDEYCGHLEYQETIGWQGNALNHLPTTLIEQLKKFSESDSSRYQTRIHRNLDFVLNTSSPIKSNLI
jgi:hypothetical protein